LLKTKGFGNVTDCELKTFATRLSYLVHIGCKPYELVECPMILLLNESEIDKRVEKLRLATSGHSISMALLKYADPKKANRVVRTQVVQYLQPLGGCMSRANKLVRELKCSDAKMMEILTRNPRIIGRFAAVPEKIRCLISYGARHEDLYRNTNLLNNKTLATIQTRAERLHKIGCTPLPLGLMGREDAIFEAAVRQEEAQRSFISGPQVASLDDVIRLLPAISANRIALIRPRIEYLLSEGYAPSDIANCPQILRPSLSRLKMAVRDLKPYHLQRVDLTVVAHYAATHRISSSHRGSVRAVIARTIGCSHSVLPPLPKVNQVHAVKDSKDIRHAVDVNARYFCDELGFRAEDLASVPLVLVHAPNVVRRHWNALDDVDDDAGTELSRGCRQAKELFRRHADNRRLRLNLLQYCIEKELNFRHACAPTWAEESDDEFRVKEMTTLAAADDSGTDGDDLMFRDDGDSETAGSLIYDKHHLVDESDSSDDDMDPLVV